MSGRRDIHITAGDDYQHTVVFDSDQSAYSFEAVVDGVSFVPTIAGASVTFALTELDTADLSGVLKWSFKRTTGDITSTILKGNAVVD